MPPSEMTTKIYTLFSDLMTYTDPCTYALQADKELMEIHNAYKVTAITPEEGEVSYETLDQQLARKIHSDLLCRQLDKDGTHSVRISIK